MTMYLTLSELLALKNAAKFALAYRVENSCKDEEVVYETNKVLINAIKELDAEMKTRTVDNWRNIIGEVTK